MKALDYQLKLKRVKPEFTIDPDHLKIEEGDFLPKIENIRSNSDIAETNDTSCERLKSFKNSSSDLFEHIAKTMTQNPFS